MKNFIIFLGNIFIVGIYRSTKKCCFISSWSFG